MAPIRQYRSEHMEVFKALQVISVTEELAVAVVKFVSSSGGGGPIYAISPADATTLYLASQHKRPDRIGHLRELVRAGAKVKAGEN
jgi:hypothetical protein